MIRFLLAAFIINLLTIAGLYVMRHRLLRLPLPGLWLLVCICSVIILTFSIAEVTLT